MQNVLVQFLSAGLLPIGEDDEKLKLLEAAALDLSKKIKAAPIQAYRIAIVSLSDQIPDSDPIFEMAGEVIRSKWQTITNKIGPNPIQVYRAVLLRAIELAATESVKLRYATLLVEKNQSLLHQDFKSTAPIKEMLANFERDLIEEFSEIWVNPINSSFPKLSTKLKKTIVNKEELSVGLSRAVGPTDKTGKAHSNPNPHWSNVGQPWSFEFVERAADAIGSLVQSSLKNYAEDVQEVFRETLQDVVQVIEGLSVRDAKAELLWIKASLYSPSCRRSFKELNDAELVLHSALDVSRAVSSMAPPSAEYYLRNLVEELAPNKKMKSSTWVASVGPILIKYSEGKEIAADQQPTKGRRSLLDVALRGYQEDKFSEQTGFSTSVEDSLSELAVKTYREFQIRKLLKP